MLKFLLSFPKLFILSFIQLFREDYAYRASALSFETLLAIIPFFTVSLYIFSFSPLFIDFIRGIENYLLTNFLPESISMINSNIQKFINNADKLSFFSILFLSITVISLFFTIRRSLNDIWKRSNTGQVKSHSRFLYWLILLIVALFFAANIVLGYYLFSLPQIVGIIKNLQEVASFTTTILSIVINTFLFAIFYIFIPDYKIRWRDGLIGGLTAAILFELAKIGFGYYINKFSNYGVIYGTFAIIPLFLFWIYLSWLILLFGAVFVHMKYQRG